MSSFRQAAGAIILNRSNHVFLGHSSRSDEWQFPQGGLLQGETAQAAVLREVAEETSLTSLSVLGELGTYRYLWPPESKFENDDVVGQEVTFFLLRYSSSEPIVILEPREFNDYKWVALNQIKWSELSPIKRQMFQLVIQRVSEILSI